MHDLFNDFIQQCTLCLKKGLSAYLLTHSDSLIYAIELSFTQRMLRISLSDNLDVPNVPSKIPKKPFLPPFSCYVSSSWSMEGFVINLNCFFWLWEIYVFQLSLLKCNKFLNSSLPFIEVFIFSINKLVKVQIYTFLYDFPPNPLQVITFPMQNDTYFRPLYFIKLNMQKYDIMGIIGQGAYGVVLKCRTNDSSQVVAIKKFKESEQDQIVKKTTMRQVKILKMLKHANIVELKQAFRKKGIVYLVFQYVQNNLLQVLQKSTDGLDPQLIRLYMYQLLKGLAYMHSLQLMHRDIKPENLLISDRKELKICDFGFARQMKKTLPDEQMTDYVATRWYRPPQLLVGAPYSKEIDIWAVGCIMGELIDGNPMFPGENQLDQLFLIQKTLGRLTPDHQETFLKNPRFLGMKFPQIHNLQTIEKKYLGKLSPKALNFLKQLLKMNPSDRLSAIDAIKHPYFDGLRQDDFIRKLSSNGYLKHDSKMSSIIPLSREQDPKTVHQDRKKYSNVNNPYTYERERTQTGTAQFNRSTKINMNKKTKEEINRLANNSKGFQGQPNSKSVNKAKPTQKQLKQKNVSLEKHQNRQIVTKTQTGFYILTGGGVIEQKEEEHTNLSNSHYSRNKIYNAKSPKAKILHKNKNMLTHAQEIAEQDQFWQSSTQLPIIMIGSQPPKIEKTNKVQQNIIITNSTFNYKSQH